MPEINNKARKVLRKYKASYFTVCALFFVISVFFAALAFAISSIALCIVFLAIIVFGSFFLRISLAKFTSKYIDSIMLQDLDLELYEAVLSQKGMKISLYKRAELAYYKGDYQKVVNICAAADKEQIPRRLKYLYLILLGKSYFELIDDEALRGICDRFNELLSHEKDASKIKKRFPVIENYENYLDKNIDACKKYYQSCEKTFAKSQRLGRVFLDFAYAQILFRIGDRSETKPLFERLVSETPKLNVAVLSQRYVDAIEGKNDSPYFAERVIPQDEGTDYFELESKAIRRYRVRANTLVVIGILMVSLSAFCEFMDIREKENYQQEIDEAQKRYEEELRKFNESIENALYTEYGTDFTYDSFQYESIIVDGETEAVLCTVDRGEDGIDFGFLVTYSGEDICFYKVIENAELNRIYSVINPSDDKQIRILMSDRFLLNADDLLFGFYISEGQRYVFTLLSE